MVLPRRQARQDSRPAVHTWPRHCTVLARRAIIRSMPSAAPHAHRHRRTVWRALLAVGLVLGLLAGCTTLDEQQRKWIFQPSDRTWWGGLAAAEGMEDAWIDFRPATAVHPSACTACGCRSRVPTRRCCCTCTVPATTCAAVPTACGACTTWAFRCWASTTAASVAAPPRCLRKPWPTKMHAPPGTGWRHATRRCRAMSSATRWAAPSRCTWRRRWPTRPASSSRAASRRSRRGHDLRVGLAAGVAAHHAALRRRGAHRQRRRAVLVVHGSEDQLIRPELGQALYERASAPKRFVLVAGGSHHNTNAVGQTLYRQALTDLFGLPASAN